MNVSASLITVGKPKVKVADRAGGSVMRYARSVRVRVTLIGVHRDRLLCPLDMRRCGVVDLVRQRGVNMRQGPMRCAGASTKDTVNGDSPLWRLTLRLLLQPASRILRFHRTRQRLEVDSLGILQPPCSLDRLVSEADLVAIIF